MPYTQPNVSITQVIAPTASSAGVATLKGCVVGPAFQIITDEHAKTAVDGDYTGAGPTLFLFGSTDVVDIEAPDTDALASAQYPVQVTLKNVVTQLFTSADLGASHLNESTGPGLPVLSGGATFGVANGDDFITWDVTDAASNADVAALVVGDFVSIATLPNYFFLISAIDTGTGRIGFSPSGLPAANYQGGSVTNQALSNQVRPFIPVSLNAGASSWNDARFDFDNTPLVVNDLGLDHLVVTEPTSFAGTIDIADAGTEAGGAGQLDLSGSFLTAPMQAIGTGIMAASVDVGTVAAASVTAIEALLAAGDEMALYVESDGVFVPITVAGTTGTNIRLAQSWTGTTGASNIYLCVMGPTTNVDYNITRTQADTPIDRGDWVFLNVSASATGVTLPAGLTAQGLTITAADVHLQYRALDESRAVLKEYANLVELSADFDAGTAALIPANPLGYAMRKAFENTTGPMSAIGVDGTYFTEGEVAAVTEAIALLEEQDVYTIALASSNSNLNSILKSHIDAQSLPQPLGPGARRIGVFNGTLFETEELVASSTTTAPSGLSADGLTFTDLAKNFAVAGVPAGGLLDISSATSSIITGQGFVQGGGRWFRDDTANGFPGVVAGDHLVILIGTDAGTYYIANNDTATESLALSAVSDLTPTAFTGDAVSNEATPGWVATTALTAGVLPTGNLQAIPAGVQARTDFTGSLVVDAFTVDMVNFETGVAGAAGPTTYSISVPAPVSAGTVVTFANTSAGGQTFVLSAGDVWSVGGTVTDGGSTFNRTTGAFVLNDSSGSNLTGDDWVVTYTGAAGPCATTEAGVISGTGVTSGTLNFDTGAMTAVTTVFNAVLNGVGGTAEVGAGGITVDYNPKTNYQIISRSSSSALIGEHTINSVNPTSLLFASSVLGDLATLGEGVPGVPATTWPDVTYTALKDLSLSEEATAIATAASGVGSSRMYMTWPDIAVASINDINTQVPGWAWNGVIAALVASLPPQQGLTRYSLAGFAGRVNGKDRFRTNARLDTIAGGGVMVFEQATSGSPVVIRHQLSTDMSSIYLQELSFRKNLDSITNTFQAMLDVLLGQYNIQEGLFTVIRTKVEGRIQSFVSSVVPKFGGQLKPGSKLGSLAVDPVNVDTVVMTIDCLLPIPLNYINVTINASS